MGVQGRKVQVKLRLYASEGGRSAWRLPAWQRLVEACGDLQTLAQEINVSPMAVGRWCKGQIPSGPARVLIYRLCEKKKIPCPLDDL